MCIHISFAIHIIAEDDNFHDIYQELACLKAHYYQLGIHLGLPASELESIRVENIQNLDRALTQMLLLWLRQQYNVAKFGCPTWKRLVQAIEKINPALARTIASSHAIVTGVYST